MTEASAPTDNIQHDVVVPFADNAPVKRISKEQVRQLGLRLDSLFGQYRADRRIAELRWLKNQRQYLGLYDPEIEKELSANRSKAYPKITRVKCISVLSRLMNLMFPGNEDNWELRASPSPDLKVEDVKQAIADAVKKDKDAGVQPELDIPYVMAAIQTLADKRAEDLSRLIKDQLEELGGDQTYDYIQLNRKALQSGILYGLGVLRGPYAREQKGMKWKIGPDGVPTVMQTTTYKPVFEFMPVWDFYPDMSAKTFPQMDGYFSRVVMSRSQIRKLCDREDFFEDAIKQYLAGEGKAGNYRPQEFETELRAMGVKVAVNEMKAETSKYEVIVWNGPVSGEFLQGAGCEIADDKLADEIDAEVWLLAGRVIKCDINPWKELDVDVKTIHPFIFDEDDTSPIGQGLPNVIRDSQMSIAAATRMLLDNASVVCGPNLELNTELLRPDQDLSSVSAYKLWYREGSDIAAQWPAVRQIPIDGHLDELIKIVDMFMKFADAETFVGPATGGDMEKAPSEPMRTAAGASMMRSDAALPFKDIVRAFDSFTQSIIESIVQFNKVFNPDKAREGDYNVIARGATSLIAKEVRGMQVDMLAQTLKPEEMIHIDERKLIEARLKVRDMGDLLVTEEEATRRKAANDAAQQALQKQQQDLAEANTRKLLSDAFKNVTQGQKNAATADAAQVKAALDLLQQGVTDALSGNGAGGQSGSGAPALPSPGDPGAAGGGAGGGGPPPAGQGQSGGLPA